jgi:2-phosphoglycerate kinase
VSRADNPQAGGSGGRDDRSEAGQPKTPHIVITDRDPGLPFSKGLMASQVMVSGLSPYRAYQVAEAIEDRLREGGSVSVTSDELSDVAHEVIGEIAGERYAKNYLRWREVERLDVPLVILIGGTTGVGKSTIATQLAARLGIVRVVATDAIREVMRSMLSPELMPTLHTSSFQADQALREPPGTAADALALGFREQTAAVAVGINALIERAAAEGTSIVIEGAHIVPGFVDLESHQDRILAVPFILSVEDEGRHLSHFATREDAVAWRPAERYAAGFENIRRLQRYVKSQALSHGVPVLPNYSFDQAIAVVMDLVMERTTQRAAEIREAALIEPDDRAGRQAGEVAGEVAGETANDPVGGRSA